MTNTHPLDLAHSSANPDRDDNGRLRPGHKLGGRRHGSKNVVSKAALQRVKSIGPKALDSLETMVEQLNWKAVALVLSYILPNGRTYEFDSLDPSEIAAELADGEGLSIGEAELLSRTLNNLANAEEVRVLRERLDEIEQLLSAARGSR